MRPNCNCRSFSFRSVADSGAAKSVSITMDKEAMDESLLPVAVSVEFPSRHMRALDYSSRRALQSLLEGLRSLCEDKTDRVEFRTIDRAMTLEVYRQRGAIRLRAALYHHKIGEAARQVFQESGQPFPRATKFSFPVNAKSLAETTDEIAHVIAMLHFDVGNRST